MPLCIELRGSSVLYTASKLESFSMWSGPRNVMTMAHAPIYWILVQLVGVKV